MASRILSNSGLEIEQTLSAGYLALVVRGIGLVRDTGVQHITGTKLFYDTATFFSGLSIVGNTTISGNIIGSLNPNSDNLYDLGNATGEWRNLWIDGTGRIDNLHVDENASVTGNFSVLGTATITGTTTLAGDFVPTNVATHYLPKTDDAFDLGSTTREFRNLWIDGTGRIDSLHVDESAFVSGSISGASVNTSGSLTAGMLFVTGSGVPLTSTSAGTRGQMVWGNNHFYVCTGTNQWGRIALTGWT